MNAEPLTAWLFEVERRGKWHVTVDRATIVRNARDPEHEACRVLLARGITTGKITFRHASDGMVGMIMDIEKGAGLTVEESENRGLRVAKYRPFPVAVASPARTVLSETAICPESETLVLDGPETEVGDAAA
jgi:hypothetical protein